ncbi:STAS/SEC14 domain-containing protein [uncultured Desulfosarcina sp.]|uniref:STAS/SEC14 domain-containing protein n=1 Tax=uncultured Desulfosarcina sp. TaxID=218289 RepID=UPI0029C791EC|nr:STAS/SEC14 domain-containing protein [uncultured Desulfosarcina sp.]
MPIQRHTDQARHLTTLTATGEISANEIMEVVRAFRDDLPALHILWDFREAYLTKSFESEFTKGIAKLAKTTVGLRRDGKTAYVASSDLVFGMCRMFTAQLGLEGALHSVMVFRELDEALKWLMDNEKSEDVMPRICQVL